MYSTVAIAVQELVARPIVIERSVADNEIHIQGPSGAGGMWLCPCEEVAPAVSQREEVVARGGFESGVTKVLNLHLAVSKDSLAVRWSSLFHQWVDSLAERASFDRYQGIRRRNATGQLRVIELPLSPLVGS